MILENVYLSPLMVSPDIVTEDCYAYLYFKSGYLNYNHDI